MESISPILIVFGGLPATGKTTVARELTIRLGAIHIRIDTIEQALRAAGREVGALGYVIAAELAADNLKLGRTTVVDCVNPVRASREGWREIAESQSARLVEIELVCSDTVLHRQRAENRSPDRSGLRHPTWDEIVNRHYEPWDRAHLVLDTATHSLAQMVDAVKAHVEQW
ncbi:AAA family ATPase [Bradyrhizobium sp. HKCCYLRH3099]|uniref:AAA family ATPase n=1 Tax=unclassified Bradyrhizobium TaxID=2631580 RepID=UPI003EB8C7C0